MPISRSTAQPLRHSDRQIGRLAFASGVGRAGPRHRLRRQRRPSSVDGVSARWFGKREREAAPETSRLELKMGGAAKRFEPLAKKPYSESAPSWRYRLRPAAFDPFDIEAAAFGAPGNADLTVRVAQRPVLDGVGGEFMEHQPEHDHNGRRTFNVLTPELEAPQTIGGKLAFENVAERGTARLGLDKQVVSCTECGNARAENFEDIVMTGKRLTQNGLNVRENVFDSMGELMIEQLSHALFRPKVLNKPAVAFGRPDDNRRGDTIENETGHLLQHKRSSVPFWRHKQATSNYSTKSGCQTSGSCPSD
jgi:hypothetical protein